VTAGSVERLRSLVRDVPDFPTPGIGFKDITPLLLDHDALHQAIDELADWSKERNPDLILGAVAVDAPDVATYAYRP